jgi:peptidyl-tRNA hydrolase
MTLYRYIVIRDDLPVGIAAAQIAHAAGEGWLAPVGTHAVVLSVPNEAELLRVAERLQRRDVDFHLVREPWPPFNGAAMAIGLPPGPRQRALAGLDLFAREGTKT